MNVQVVYCNYHSAALAVRERLAFSDEDQLRRAYVELRTRFPRSEHVVVSTCNRVELYSAQEEPEDAPTHAQLAEFFSEFHAIPLAEFFHDLLEQTGPEAVRHLFEVASSVDSMVLGESQIVSQVKRAYELAQQSDANGPLTNALFQRAMKVSSRVRSETRLSEGRISVASVAVGDFGKSIFDHFADKSILVIGAGEMAEETLRYLQGEGAKRITVLNRSREKAETLAREFGGRVEQFDQLDRCLTEADIVVSTTGAAEPIVTVERFRELRKKTGPKTMFVLDLGAPRDFEPASGDVDDGVFLYDIDDLERTCEANRKARAGEIAKARQIIEEETSSFMHDVYHKATGPIVKRLREHWHDISRQEMESLFNKLPHLDDNDRQAVERTVQRIVNKLLHPPLETLRDEAREGPPHGLMDAIRRLFHLHD